MQSYGFILKQPKFFTAFFQIRNPCHRKPFLQQGFFYLGIIKNDETGIFIMLPFHTHKYCRWLVLSCRSNIHKFGWCPTELV